MKYYLFVFFVVFITSCERHISIDSEIVTPNTITPKTVQPMPIIDSSTPQRVLDLVSLTIALEQYKIDHRSYPVSSNSGKGWDGLYTKYGESSENWIKGLTPNYIEVLPRDPRKNTSTSQQYLYRSNGANYKLLAFYDCHEISNLYPEMIDPKRKCLAYGYWTPRASHW